MVKTLPHKVGGKEKLSELHTLMKFFNMPAVTWCEARLSRPGKSSMSPVAAEKQAPCQGHLATDLRLLFWIFVSILKQWPPYQASLQVAIGKRCPVVGAFTRIRLQHDYNDIVNQFEIIVVWLMSFLFLALLQIPQIKLWFLIKILTLRSPWSLHRRTGWPPTSTWRISPAIIILILDIVPSTINPTSNIHPSWRKARLPST